MRWRTLCLFLAPLLIMGFFAQEYLVSTIFQWYLKSYCANCLNGELSYEKLHHKNGTWTIEHPAFLSYTELHKGGHRFQAENATISTKIAWVDRRIDLTIALTDPQIDIGAGADELKRLLQLPSQEFGFFSIHSRFTVPKGSLLLADVYSEQTKAPIFFNIEMTCKDKKEGCFCLWFNEHAYAKEIKHLEILFSGTEPATSKISLHVNGVCCQELMAALKHIWPNLQNCEISQGIVQGNVVFDISSPSHTSGKGKLVINDLKLHHSAYELDCHIPSLSITLSPASEKDNSAPFHTVADMVISSTVNQGHVDADLKLCLQGFNPAKMSIDNLYAQQFDIKLSPWNISCGAGEIQGKCSLDLSASDIWQTLHSDLKIADGHLCLAGLDQAKCLFSNIDTTIAVREGIVQKTIVKATVAGLKGDIEIDGNSPNEIAKLNFIGLPTNVAEIFPLNLKKGIEKKFSNDELKINAIITRGYNGARITGKTLLVNKNNSHADALDFEFSLEKPCYTIKDGKFKGDHLPLEKFISPFIFSRDQMNLSGIGEFEGNFDAKQINVNYNAHDLILENSDFCIDVKSLNTLPAPLPNLTGTFTYDFKKKRCISHLPIYNGTYFEKNSGLLFYDVNANVILEDDKAHLSHVEAFCNGIFFGGVIDLDWSMPGDGVFDVDIHSHEIQGKVSQVQDFLSHFNHSLFLLKLPIDGNVELQKKGAHLHFSFFPGDYVFQSKILGAISDAALLHPIGNVSAQELNLNVYYNHQLNLLEFSDIQGTLFVGSPGHIEEYDINGEHIRFTDYANNKANFDLWINDKQHELLRLAGTTQPMAINGHNNFIDFNFDRTLTHFGDVHPSSFKLILKDWSDVELFHLDFNFNLRTLLQDLQRFTRTGFFFLSRNLLKEINDIQFAQGDFKVNLQYEGQKGMLVYNVIGSNAAIDNHTTQQFLFNGKKKESTWIIDQLQFDQVSLAADILKDNDSWNVNFLAARIGKSLLLGMEGQYKDDPSVLNAKINLLEIDFAHLNEWPSLKALCDEYQLAGQMRAHGTMQIQLDKSLPQKMHIDTHLNCALRNGKWRSLHFQDFENASLDYISNKGLCLKGVHTALKSAKDGSPQANLFLQSANADFINNELLVDSLLFQVPAKNLTWFSENLQQSFPDLISPCLGETIQNCKLQGAFNGELKFEFSQPHCALCLILDDGTYRFMQRDHDVSRFILEYDPFELKISTKYRIERHQFWLTARSPAATMNKGEIILSEQALDTYNELNSFPLTVNWEMDPAHGLILNKIEGSLCGLKCDLVRDPSCAIASDQLFLRGEVHANLSKAQALLNPEIAAICNSWEIGQGYCLKGQWALAKDNNKPLHESLTFQGELNGRDFELGGYQFFHLSGQVGYSGNALRIANISIADPSGNMRISDAMLSKKSEGNWSIDIPSMSIYNFRPSLLYVRSESPPSMAKALVIKQFDLRNFQGTLGDRSSYSGKGRFLFANPPKRNLQHTIFALPAELMTRLGLDFGVLNPVRGLISFDIKDSKIIFTRFKDVYSKGRLSKFYLSNSNFPSYMDFDGNLNLRIRMKQYNLFFKLAELFTITVQGHLKKPSFSLQRQVRRSPKIIQKEMPKSLVAG